MKRNIHDIFDVILKIIIMVYGTIFLNYIGIQEEIEELLSVELTTLTGKKFYLDFLCLLKNGTICHIEFQYPKAEPKDSGRFFNYNIVAQVRYQMVVETTIFNFTKKINEEKPQEMGETKYFNPNQFYLGDVDFEEYIRKINIKVESNIQFSPFEEITLLLMSVNPEFDNKFGILQYISKILKKKNLFDETRFEFFQSVIELEIENFLTKEEQEEIEEEIKMTPKAMAVVTQAINEVNQKTLAEAKDDARAEAWNEAWNEAWDKAWDEAWAESEADTTKKIAKSLRDTTDLNELSRATGLTVDEIKRL